MQVYTYSQVPIVTPTTPVYDANSIFIFHFLFRQMNVDIHPHH